MINSIVISHNHKNGNNPYYNDCSSDSNNHLHRPHYDCNNDGNNHLHHYSGCKRR